MSHTSIAHWYLDFDAFCHEYAGQPVCLIDGEVFEMSPVGQAHIDCVECIADWLRHLRTVNAIHVREEKPLYTLGSDPEPDIAVMPGSRKQARGQRADAAKALLVVEVSDSSLKFDSGKKLPKYAQAAVPEGWIVDIAQHRVIVHREPNPEAAVFKSASVHRTGDTLSPLFARHEELAVTDVFGIR